MSDKAKRVLAVWSTLTKAERDEAIKLINNFQNSDEKRKEEIALESFNESASLRKSTTMNFGPLGGGCPYCGK
ncbi:TPA: hypothetical protein NO555_004486 [Klebsiella variicola subsp. variicola]|uniref:hypothetical protein n=1 Tax=Klebsiella sp. K-Nf6 TaxID=2054595 RepID=UPI000C28EC63|nr:hypothetical protein [Klebsiella sp. K-Nf6]PJR61365.1 hypothetical protein CWM61_20255 [Klebsiella sp. K-Nf6]HCI4281135.1 hypothetical protein [Klebsiella variicola subsp. variicola]HCI4626460.1 hypothetical protein [Klebsiella variicola subsp. variicola]HCI6659932.1 hypothetical protein [Klebsiella variicola subsp. variicola]